ncbi:MAG: hypothetical protein U1F68_13625 [Gammaproteobacteria bacterium]
MKRFLKSRSVKSLLLATLGLSGLALANFSNAEVVISYPADGAVLTSLDRIEGYDKADLTTNVRVALFSMDGDAAWNGRDHWIPTPGTWLSTWLYDDMTWTAPWKWMLPQLANGHYRIIAVSIDSYGHYSEQQFVDFSIRH